MKENWTARVSIGLALLLSTLTAPTKAQVNDEIQLGLSYTLSLGGVAKELELTDDQQSNLGDLWMMTQSNLQTAIRNYQEETSPSLPNEIQQELKDRLAAEIQKSRDTEVKLLESVLSKQQLERLKQIRFQFLNRSSKGLSAIQEELNLTKGQLDQIQSINKTLIKEINEMQTSARNLDIPAADVQHNIVQIRKNAKEKLNAILSPAQQQRLLALQGKKFEFQYGPVQPADDASDNEPKQATAE